MVGRLVGWLVANGWSLERHGLCGRWQSAIPRWLIYLLFWSDSWLVGHLVGPLCVLLATSVGLFVGWSFVFLLDSWVVGW